MYAIIDVETTGGGHGGHRITDIAILVHDGKRIIDEFQSLVNPEIPIPFWITRLTGISDEMVVGAPRFHEIADDVLRITKGHIFVAHSVNFDYGVIRGEFERLGVSFDRLKLCSVKTARRLLPGHKSYSLGKICRDLGITIHGRHRAYGDARATVELMEVMLQRAAQQGENDLIKFMSGDAFHLPEHVNWESYSTLPESPGVYYLRNKLQETIYIGYGSNIKQKVTGHFNRKRKNQVELWKEIFDISFELTGSELVASLLHAHEVDRTLPRFNRTTSRKIRPAALIKYENRTGILELTIGHAQNTTNEVAQFSTQEMARTHLDRMMRQFKLCPKYCGWARDGSVCLSQKEKTCHGVCSGKEPVEDYNAKVDDALRSMMPERSDYFIVETGRTQQERGIVYIKEGVYQGFGYVKATDLEGDPQGLLDYVEFYPDNRTTQLFIKQYLADHQKADMVRVQEAIKERNSTPA